MATIDAVLATILGSQPGQSMSARRLTALAFLTHWRHSRDYRLPLTSATWFMTASGPASFDIRDVLMAENGRFLVYRADLRGHRTTMCRLLPSGAESRGTLRDEEASSIRATLRETRSLPDAAVQRMVSRVDSVLSTSGYPGTPIEFAPFEKSSPDQPIRTP